MLSSLRSDYLHDDVYGNIAYFDLNHDIVAGKFRDCSSRLIHESDEFISLVGHTGQVEDPTVLVGEFS